MSNLSDFLTVPLAGVSKPDDNTLKLLRPLAEIQAIASDATVTGINAGSLRLRNVYQANAAGPNIYLEGTNSAAAVKQVGRINANFIDYTTAIEKSQLVLTVLQVGANVSVALRGDATANLAPTAVAGVALGTQALPWKEAWVGNVGATKTLKMTSTGPSNENALITENSALVIYNGAAPTYSLGGTALTMQGTGSFAQTIYAGSAPANTNFLTTTVATTGVSVNSTKAGTGVTQDVTFQIDGTRVMQFVAAQGDVVVGKTGLATGATSGHIYVPAVAGAMTGVPTARAGFVPLYVDTMNLKIGVYTGGAWKHTAALT